MSPPSKGAEGGEGDQEVVEGTTPDTGLGSAPSTILRMVPLPREERGRIQ